ncbi:MAG: low molecular weight phosphotyrosine protein phosphatase [Flavobacteriales bacterium]|nr:low molecular weight phosphotyrosine protein phosphatase [Flavobacteriales bacterium]
MRILTVCLGNICRSPMAEGVLRHRAAASGLEVVTDSAGTSHFHTGEAPDRRAREAMRRHGIDISDLRARQVVAEDFERFDLLLAMDASNLRDLHALAPSEALRAKAVLMMDFAPGHAWREVPDPYYGGDEGFDEVYHMLDEAVTGLIARIRHGR